MSKLQTKLNINAVGRVCVTVADTDRAIDFYVDTLGFEKVVDVPMGPDMRWVEVALPGTDDDDRARSAAARASEAGGSQTGICLDTSDVDADHAALKAAGVDVDDEVTRYGGPGAADVLAARPGRQLADRRRADVLARTSSSTCSALPGRAPAGPALSQRTPIAFPGSRGVV